MRLRIVEFARSHTRSPTHRVAGVGGASIAIHERGGFRIVGLTEREGDHAGAGRLEVSAAARSERPCFAHHVGDSFASIPNRDLL